MVEFIANDETSLSDQVGDVGRVRGKAHAKDDGVLGAQELGHLSLELLVDLLCANLVYKKEALASVQLFILF